MFASVYGSYFDFHKDTISPRWTGRLWQKEKEGICPPQQSKI